MKSISMQEARAKLADLVEQAQAEPVWLTRHGKPVAMLLGVEGRVDIGSVVIEGRPEFWEMIEKVRKSKRPRHSEAEVRRKLGLPPAKRPLAKPALAKKALAKPALAKKALAKPALTKPALAKKAG